MKSFLEMIIREVIGAGILGLVLAPFMETETDYLSLLILFLLVRIIDRALHWTGISITNSIVGTTCPICQSPAKYYLSGNVYLCERHYSLLEGAE